MSYLCGDPDYEDVQKPLRVSPVCEPERVRVPTVKAAMGSRSNLSCCSSYTPIIY